MFVQKLYKNGNSVAVTIPKPFLRELNLRDGSKVVVEKKGDELVISSNKHNLAPEVDVKFMRMVDDFIEDHQDVLKELSQK